jgi:DNA polymerase III delta prime subunit
MQHPKPSLPISVFCVAAQSDAALLAQWETHLFPLQQAKWLTFWSEHHLQAGTDRKQIHEHLNEATCIILLVSADFFVDPLCLEVMQRALQLQQEHATRVIPLLLRPVEWQESEMGTLPSLPSNGVPVTQWPTSDDAFHTCVQDLQYQLGLPRRTPLMSRTGTRRNPNRERMLRRLRDSYSSDLAQSLQKTAWLDLGLIERPDAVQSPINLSFKKGQQSEQPLPSGTTIVQVYHEVQEELLILGEPGAGKSTLLLHLAQHLVNQAERDESCPIPVILPLSSWAVKQSPLTDWMSEQIAQVYGVPRKVSQGWVQQEQILPLLDGLDEMEEGARPACIAAINMYHREHFTPLVVCSRTTEYEVLAEKQSLVLQSAVVVRPLTRTQVEAALHQAGEPAAALRTALHAQPTLQELATAPLMLNVMMLTYQRETVTTEALTETTLEQQVWTAYVERMVTRKDNARRYPLEQTRAWLGWLARQMRGHNQMVFYLEHLQPDSLSTHQQRIYAWQAIRLPAIVIGILISILVQLFLSGGDNGLPSLLHYGFVGGLLGGLWHGPMSEKGNQGEHHTWRKGLLIRLAISACIGLIYGLSFGFPLCPCTLREWQIYGLPHGVMIGLSSLLLQYLLTASFRSGTSPGNPTTRRWKQIARFFQVVLGPRVCLVAAVIGLSNMLSAWMSFVLRDGQIYWQRVDMSDPYSVGTALGLSAALSILLTAGLISGLNFGLTYALINLTLGTQMRDIHLTERIRWTRRSLRRGLFNSRLLLNTAWLTCISMIFVMVSNGLTYGLVNALLLGPLLGQTIGLTKTLQAVLSYGLSLGLSYGLSFGLSLGLSYWFLFGLFQGIAQERIDDKDRRVANEGIHRSLSASVVMGIIGGITIGIIAILSNTLHDGLSFGLNDGLTLGLSIGLIQGPLIGVSGALFICMIMGGIAVWRHYVIRLLLSRAHTFPWKAAQFLDDATTRILLRRVGGGYSFTHRLLLDHFADMETGAMPSANASPTQLSHP